MKQKKLPSRRLDILLGHFLQHSYDDDDDDDDEPSSGRQIVYLCPARNLLSSSILLRTRVTSTLFCVLLCAEHGQ